MTVKLNVNRTQWIDVPLPGHGVFKVEMKILKTDQEDLKVAELIVGVEDLEIEDDNGNILSKDDTVKAIQNDSQLSSFVSQAWALGNQNTLKKQRTLLQPQED